MNFQGHVSFHGSIKRWFLCWGVGVDGGSRCHMFESHMFIHLWFVRWKILSREFFWCGKVAENMKIHTPSFVWGGRWGVLVLCRKCSDSRRGQWSPVFGGWNRFLAYPCSPWKETAAPLTPAVPNDPFLILRQGRDYDDCEGNMLKIHETVEIMSFLPGQLPHPIEKPTFAMGSPCI